ncbi:universal stress protein [Pseudomonas aeruginosa]|uniref:universal stress protein n=1 Tax=Pseudomonas aeruginosa TaxID=287 RepID=UPI000A62CF90|nr:universal stress protein [Pseudomonas aeruginosa]
MRNVLLPFDGSASARRAIQYLLDLAGEYPSIQVHVINVQTTSKLHGDYVSAVMLEQLHAGALNHAQEIAAEAAALLERRVFASRFTPWSVRSSTRLSRPSRHTVAIP